MIRLVALSKHYANGQVAVDSLNLEVEEGDVCVLLGPSGCGKTTTLKMINRLVEPTGGQIFIGDEDVTGIDPVVLRRRIGYVIQQVGLFPHLRVADNVGTVPRLLGWDRQRTRRRVDELLDLVGLDPGVYRDRYPHQLSGGQRQRVGVARALGVDPPVLLMDEPFGAIDPISRDRLQQEFLRLQSELNKTVMFVTHDIDEAVRLGDRIAVLREGGVLEQFASPADVLGRPASPFVAELVGADRGLKRLSVMAIDTAALATLPTVGPMSPMADARRSMDETDAAWAVVVDDEGWLVGVVHRDDAEPGRTASVDESVDTVVRPVGAAVEADATLKDAFSQLLLNDADWVAVVDRGRYRGVLTLEGLHAAIRRSVHQTDPGPAA